MQDILKLEAFGGWSSMDSWETSRQRNIMQDILKLEAFGGWLTRQGNFWTKKYHARYLETRGIRRLVDKAGKLLDKEISCKIS